MLSVPATTTAPASSAALRRRPPTRASVRADALTGDRTGSRDPNHHHPQPSAEPSITLPIPSVASIADRVASVAAAAACCAMVLCVAPAPIIVGPAFAAASPAAAVAPAAAYRDPVVARAAERLADAFQARQYYVTGDLPEGLFADECVFIDPTTRVQGAAKYASVVAQLFDARSSRADLLSIGPGPEPSTLSLRWRLEGQLSLPGNPPIKAYTGTTLYKIDAATGVVREQLESWDISAFDAFASSFLPPSLWRGAPPAPPVEVLLREQQQQQQQ